MIICQLESSANTTTARKTPGRWPSRANPFHSRALFSLNAGSRGPPQTGGPAGTRWS